MPFPAFSRQSIGLLITVLLLTAPMTAADPESPSEAPTPRDMDQIVASGELVLLTFPHQESLFSRTNLARGTPMPRLGSYSDFEGADIDLIKRFADSLGVELRVRPVSEPRYAALIPDLLAGRGDLIASSLSITEERQKHVDFSHPYFQVESVIVTVTGAEITSFEQLSQHVGVVTSGSSHEQRLLSAGIESDALLRVDFSLETYVAVLEGDADYTLADSVSALRFFSTQPGLEIAFVLDGSDDYGVAVPKGSPNLLQALNLFIDRAHASGDIERILAKHIEQIGPIQAQP